MIDPDDDRPMYRQVVEALEERIASGAIPGGYPLPAEQAVMAEFGVSRITVRRAVEELRRAGLVVTRKGFGTYVRARGVRHVVRLAAGTVIARPATRPEARRHLVSPGWPMLVVRRGGVEVVLPADRVVVEVSPRDDSG